MEKSSTIEGIEVKDLEGIAVAGKSLENNKDYMTSDEIYKSLRDSEIAGNFGKCVWNQCVYSKTG